LKRLILLFFSVLLTSSIFGQNWNQIGNDIDGEASGDYSGEAVSFSSDGNTVAIGAVAGNNSGHVRIYNWNGSSWTQLGQDIDGEAVNDYSDYI